MRKKKLTTLKNKLINFTSSPLYNYRIEEGNLPVMGEGSVFSAIVFIGEAPGKNEAKNGKPFCGRAGEILNNQLEKINIKRSDVYITNIVKDRPPTNRDPLPEEIDLYAPFLDEEIKIISPKIIVPLGRFSTYYILNRYHREEKTKPISILQGKTIEIKEKNNTIQILPLFHPASIIYDKKKEKPLERGFLELKKLYRKISRQ